MMKCPPCAWFSLQQLLRYAMQVCITNEDTCDGVGVLATGAIREGECVAMIPRAAVLSCNNSTIADLVREDDALNQDSTSSWVPLLLSLSAEYSKKSSIFSRVVCY